MPASEQGRRVFIIIMDNNIAGHGRNAARRISHLGGVAMCERIAVEGERVSIFANCMHGVRGGGEEEEVVEAGREVEVGGVGYLESWFS